MNKTDSLGTELKKIQDTLKKYSNENAKLKDQHNSKAKTQLQPDADQMLSQINKVTQ